MTPTILITGAGPTGLVLALWLTKLGIPVRIIDKDQTSGETSRAIAVQARTLEFYRQINISEEIIAQGVITQSITMLKNKHKMLFANLSEVGKGLSPFPYILALAQDEHEKILIAHLSRLGVEVERQTELVEFTQDDHGVRAVLKKQDQLEHINIDYICGCDGAHSTVRQSMGLDFPGGTYSQFFYVADVMATGEYEKNGLEICVSKQDFCIVMPIRSSGSMRLIGIVPPESEKKTKIEFADVEESVTRNTGLKIEKINWFSVYHVHHRIADHFKKGRAFLLGDAAHIHSPAGGQGMNTGIGDAVNLAWKLADVIKGRADSTLLDTYEQERLPFAKKLVETTDQLFRLIANRSWLGSCWRSIFFPFWMPILFRWKFTARFFFRTVSQTTINYRQCALKKSRHGKIQIGDRLPWVQYDNYDNFERLKTLEWQAHVYGTANASLRMEMQKQKIPLYEFTWCDNAKKAGLTRNAAYVLRPDGYISYFID